jgi:hypothetical protein
MSVLLEYDYKINNICCYKNNGKAECINHKKTHMRKICFFLRFLNTIVNFFYREKMGVKRGMKDCSQPLFQGKTRLQNVNFVTLLVKK